MARAHRQNVFQRLKRFQVGGNNPEENHATEVLAGCLYHSDLMREAFLRLCGMSDASGQWEIATQVVASAESRWDLVFRRVTPPSTLVVEVKVGDVLTCAQVVRYLSELKRGWPSSAARAERSLAVLVPSEESLEPAAMAECRGAAVRIVRWSEVAASFAGCLEELGARGPHGETEGRLIKTLLTYLELELDVMNFDPTDLLAFAPGMRAAAAVNALLDYCARSTGHGGITNGRRVEFPARRLAVGNQWIELHFRSFGVKGWSAGHTIALGACCWEQPVAELDKLRTRLAAEAWQIWVPDLGARWRPIAGNEPIPISTDSIYAYRPLVGERINGVFSNEAGHQDPLRDWGSFRSWHELADSVAAAFVDGIRKVFPDAVA